MSADRFIGTWRLVAFEARTSHGDVSYPYGQDPAGYLLYTADGFMFASVMRSKRPNFGSPDIQGAGSEEKVAAFDSYASYCGRYEVKEERVIHQVEVSLLPNWSGKDQERFFEFSGERLTLRTPPMLDGGVERILVAIWQRVSS